MKHLLLPDGWRCSRCGMPAARTQREPTCHPDDGSSFVAFLGYDAGAPDARPSDTEAPDGA